MAFFQSSELLDDGEFEGATLVVIYPLIYPQIQRVRV